MALFYDVTKAASSKQLSGLIRVSRKMGQALSNQLAEQYVPVEWHSRKRCFRVSGSRQEAAFSPQHHFLTPEVFSSDNRPGLYELLSESGVRSAAVFHDAIPWTHPEITWPKSVERHPQYMNDLSGLDQVFSVSQASQDELERYWAAQEIGSKPELSVVSLGADFFDRSQIDWSHQMSKVPVIVNVGIIEPRKNQAELLEVACRLWDGGHEFELHFVGRINPHFGKPIAKQIKKAMKSGYPVFLHSKQTDTNLLDLYSKASFTVFNSIAEGFGLPVVESIWLGIPCITRNLPSLKNYVGTRACIGVENSDDMELAMAKWLGDSAALVDAAEQANSLSMLTWEEAVRPIVDWKRKG